MSTNTKVSVLDHAVHTAHTVVNDVARELDAEDREFAYRVHGSRIAAFLAGSGGQSPQSVPSGIRTLLQPRR